MSKLLIGVMIIIFWLSFGFAMTFLNLNYGNTLYKDLQEKYDSSGISVSTTVTRLIAGINLFFSCITLTIPNVPTFLSIIVIIMEAISFIVALFLILSSIKINVNLGI